MKNRSAGMRHCEEQNNSLPHLLFPSKNVIRILPAIKKSFSLKSTNRERFVSVSVLSVLFQFQSTPPKMICVWEDTWPFGHTTLSFLSSHGMWFLTIFQIRISDILLGFARGSTVVERSTSTQLSACQTYWHVYQQTKFINAFISTSRTSSQNVLMCLMCW